MKREFYYPRVVAAQPAWHFNYADQLEKLGGGIGLQAAAVASSVNDSRHVGYTIGAWLNSVREFSRGCTGQAAVLKHGSGNLPFELPVFNPPVLPEGLSGVFANQRRRRWSRKEANTMRPAKDDAVLSDLRAMRL